MHRRPLDLIPPLHIRKLAYACCSFGGLGGEGGGWGGNMVGPSLGLLGTRPMGGPWRRCDDSFGAAVYVHACGALGGAPLRGRGPCV